MQHKCVYSVDSFSSLVEEDIRESVSVIGCWARGSALCVCLLTGYCVTNQVPQPHLGNQIVTHSLWASAGHLEILVFYLPATLALCDVHTHTNKTVFSLSVQEIAAYLITFEKHDEWLTTSPKTR